MGKKDKKKKGLGKAKTEAKAAKKEKKASRKAREADGEDVEAILAEILAKEEAAVAVAEHQNVDPPKPRTAFTMVASSANEDELIYFGGERYTGDRATFFNDLYVFNIEKETWARYDSPNRPPPRSSHAAAVHRNMMYVFGGEFSNPSLSQYRHYNDLWRLDLTDMGWERIEIRGGPSRRSGHRMCVVDSKLLVFGGYFDDGYKIKHLNDMYFVDLSVDELKWTKVETSAVDVVPSPRSGFQWGVLGKDVYLYGGYCREVVQKAKTMSHKGKKKGGSAVEEAMVSQGVILTDCYKLSGENLKWQKVKKTGYGPSRRAGFAMVVHKRNAIVFGGVEDDETEEDMESIFYNDMFALNLDRKKWFPMTLRKKKGKKGRRRRKKAERGMDSKDVVNQAEEAGSSTRETQSEEKHEEDEDDEKELDTEALEAALMEEEEEVMPCKRFNAAVAIQKNVLYIAGGVIERGEQDVTLDDLWAIDLNKMEEFKEVKGLSEECSEWIASDEEEEEEEEEEAEDEAEGEEEDEDDDEREERKRRRGGRRDRLRERVSQAEDDHFTPKVNESLKDFFERTRPYWIGEVHEALGESGKTLRRIAFEWAFKRYWEVKPSLKELEELEAELAREEELEKQFAKAQLEHKRGRGRR